MSEPLDPLLDPRAASDDARADVVELPGQDRPEWLLPVLVIAFGSLIAGLVIFGQPDADPIGTATEALPVVTAASVDDPTAVEPAATDAAPTTDRGTDAPVGQADGTAVGEPDPPPVGADAAVVDPIGDAAEASDDPTGGVVTDLDLPAPGTIRVGDAAFPLLRSCVDLRPLAPNSTDDVVSAHVFSPDGDREQVVERWFTAAGIGGVRVDGPGAPGVRQVSVADGVDGSFAATLERPDGDQVELVVNPIPEDERSCEGSVVTNEPGQFAFPYTRAVLAVCAVGDPAADGRLVAILTEGGRMVAASNGDGSHTLRLRAPETLLGDELDLTDSAGELFADGTRLGYSGLVTDGTTSLDLTFDVDVAVARPCADDER